MTICDALKDLICKTLTCTLYFSPVLFMYNHLTQNIATRNIQQSVKENSAAVLSVPFCVLVCDF